MAEEKRDPTVAIPLLWRNEGAAPPATAPRGPRQRSSVDAVVTAASRSPTPKGSKLCRCARRGSPRARGDVGLHLRSEQARAGRPHDRPGDRRSPSCHRIRNPLRERLEGVARRQWDDYRRHPWLLQVDTSRPALGPNVSRRWEWQLGAVEGLGLGDIDMDQIVTLVVALRRGPGADGLRCRAALARPPGWAIPNGGRPWLPSSRRS